MSNTKVTNNLQNLQKNLETFKMIFELEQDLVTKIALVHMFELTFELSWKLMKSLLEVNDVHVNGTRAILKNSGKIDLIDSVEDWIEIQDLRNKSTHAYKEEVLDTIADRANSLIRLTEELLEVSKEYL